ncbi:MAG TPA: class I SAM-dependent methyltransferase [Terriglobales bacterium]|nr:class I SAM-dependent methyltransferase [Terriglobales bacterium]
MDFRNCYEDVTRADAYATLEFKNTYYLAFRDLPAIIQEHVHGSKALDFGCGAGRSSRLLRQLGFEVTGVDIAEDMIRKARQLDSSGDYRLVPGDDFSALPRGGYDLVLSAFTFDNIPGRENKIRIFRDLRELLRDGGKIVHIVSTPEIYIHEWTSFSTKDFPENHKCRSGDTVKVIVMDHADLRPVEDILWTDESYRDVFSAAGLNFVKKYLPLATGHEPYTWVNETRIAPWAIYVLERALLR